MQELQLKAWYQLISIGRLVTSAVFCKSVTCELTCAPGSSHGAFTTIGPWTFANGASGVTGFRDVLFGCLENSPLRDSPDGDSPFRHSNTQKHTQVFT
jgi:hypothetical protein